MSRVHLFCVLVLVSSMVGPVLGKEEESYWDKAKDKASCYAIPIAAGVVGVAALPVVLPAAGFTSAGIAAGSLAAKGMSLAAATGHGMAIVSAGQSAGAAGVTLATKAVVFAGSAFSGWYMGGCSDPDCDKNK